MKPKEPLENRIGPVNPFAMGNVFIEAAKKLGWMEEEQVERQRRYFITPKGFAEMEKLGMDLQRVLHYRPMTPQPENTLSRHERPAPQPGSHPMRPARPRLQDRNDDRQPSRPRLQDRNDDRQPARHQDRQHDRHRDRHPDRHRH